ncbi:prepilin peptidase [Citrobacter sp. Cpo142]|uniref:prepilin peptidase n=1 Tax=Citrobacter sp. Cpo142 TaxID=2985151 RepID=UPI002577C543|nr:prepilin peptidase [Citrobacter sp. Cpo142]MDM2776275.1 prepilin peptidase [Citrobacter sp. Cpo142]
MMIFYLIVLSVLAYYFTLMFPVFYKKEKQNVIAQSEVLIQETDDPGQYRVLAIVMFIMPVAIFSFSESMLLSWFCFILAVVAYTDLSSRWIPDLAIYVLLVLSMLSIQNSDLNSALWSVLLYLFPAVLISVYGFLVKKKTLIATGDYYVIPSIGLMILPEHASSLMLVNFIIVVAISRWIQKIPLVTVAYFTFTGYQLCLHSGLL